MAQVKLLKTDTDGVPVGMNSTADDITLNSYTIQGGGPVLSGTGLDLNAQDISDIKNVSFNNSATATISINSTTFIADNMMFETKENTMTTAGAVLFPVVTDDVDQLDAFRLPAIAGTPTATPADGGEGYLVWDSTNDKLYAWTGSLWDDLSTVEDAKRVTNSYTADGAITIGDAVYISANDKVKIADVSGATIASRVMGLAKSTVLDTASVDIVCQGTITNGAWTLTAGSRYYGDPAVAGGLTTTIPAGTGNTIVQLGYAKNATTMHVHIEQMGRRA